MKIFAKAFIMAIFMKISLKLSEDNEEVNGLIESCLEGTIDEFFTDIESAKEETLSKEWAVVFTKKGVTKLRRTCEMIDNFKELMKREHGLTQQIIGGLLKFVSPSKTGDVFTEKQRADQKLAAREFLLYMTTKDGVNVQDPKKVEELKKGNICENIFKKPKSSIRSVFNSFLTAGKAALTCVIDTKKEEFKDKLKELATEIGKELFLKIAADAAVPILELIGVVKFIYTHFMQIVEILKSLLSKNPDERSADEIIFSNFGTELGNAVFDWIIPPSEE